MSRIILFTLLAGMIIATAGCTYYETAPGTYSTTGATKFDRAWNAVIGAYGDQGVTLSRQDRSSGEIEGSRQGINVTTTLQTQADGSVRVAFHTSGATANDPDLVQRITRSYNVRMGR